VDATKEISEHLIGVAKESTRTMKSMESTSEEVKRVSIYMGQVEDSLDNIVKSSVEVSSQIMNIATAVEQQSTESGGIAKNIVATSSIAKEIENMSGAVMKEVDKLAKVTGILEDSTSQFKLSAVK